MQKSNMRKLYILKLYNCCKIMTKLRQAGIKERFLVSGGAFSGILSFLGSYQVCHNICMGIIAILAGLGIVLKGMPLLFLQKVALPFWIAAVLMLLILTLLKLQNRMCISKNNLLLNSGLIIAGIPFRAVQNYSLYFWIIGGIIVLISAARFVKKKFGKNEKV